MRKLCILMLIPLMLLTGCTRVADRIYTVCKRDNDDVYVFSGDNVYTLSGNDVTLCYDPNIVKEPALRLFPTDKSFTFTYVLPGLYQGTLEDVCSYIQYLSAEDDIQYVIEYADNETINIAITSHEYVGRILYNTHGEVRMYFKNNSGLYIAPVYILSEK